MMRALGKKIFETFKVFPKQFVYFLLELHYVLANESNFVDRVDFFKKALNKSSHVMIELTNRL